MSSHVVNWEKLIDALEMACQIRQVTMEDVAKEIGIAPSGITRMRQGHRLSADGLVSLVAWLFPGNVPLWVSPSLPQEGGTDT